MGDTSGYIKTGNNELHYRKWGAGSKVLLAFHGYGDVAELFLPLVDYLTDQYTIITIDLPHHGGSTWAHDAVLTSADVVELTHQLLIDYKVTTLSLIGYSLGGRVCLSILEHSPSIVDRMVLIAPDGLKKDPYYYFFTQTWLGAGIFRNMLVQPWPYIKMIGLLKHLKLVHASRHKFATYFLQSAENRVFLRIGWPAMRGVMPDPGRVKNIIAKNRVHVTIFMGAYDRIMPPAIGHKFKEGLETVQMHILDKGHRILDNETARRIAGSLL